MQKTEQTIQNYKSAMQEIDAVSEKYEKVVAMKKQELDTCQKGEELEEFGRGTGV